ncbi:hypothetical protein LEMLEM_LOCUS23049, partial [Lemmus lemmus]
MCVLGGGTTHSWQLNGRQPSSGQEGGENPTCYLLQLTSTQGTQDLPPP